MKSITAILFLTVGVISSALSQQSKRLTKEETIALYRSLYLTSELESMPWDGDWQKCECGTLNNEIYRHAENRINFFRLINGLNKVKVSVTFNTEAQHAALLSRANDQLTHYPTQSMKCIHKPHQAAA